MQEILPSDLHQVQHVRVRAYSQEYTHCELEMAYRGHAHTHTHAHTHECWDANIASDIGGNLAETEISEEEALKRFREEALSHHGKNVSESDLEVFSDTAYFEFLLTRKLI